MWRTAALAHVAGVGASMVALRILASLVATNPGAWFCTLIPKRRYSRLSDLLNMSTYIYAAGERCVKNA